MTKIAGSGSISQRHGSDPDPPQNVMDSEHCKERAVLPFLDLPGGERIHELGVGILGRVAPARPATQLPHAGEVQAARAQQQRGDNHQTGSAALPQQTHRQLYQVQMGCNKNRRNGRIILKNYGKSSVADP